MKFFSKFKKKKYGKEDWDAVQERLYLAWSENARNQRILREKEESARQLLIETAQKCGDGENIDADVIQHNFLSQFQLLSFPQYFPFTIKLPEQYCLEKGCVIDLETTSLSHWSGHIVTMGILEKNYAIVHQLTAPNYKSFQSYCFQKARETQEPRYSYNARFESEFLEMEQGWVDLMQYFRVSRIPVCERGLKISKAKENQIVKVDDFNYKVHSQNSDQWYAVNISGDPCDWSCDCSFYNEYFERCKHIWAVVFSFEGVKIEQVKRDELFTKFRKSLGKCTSPAFKEPAISGRDVPRIWQQYLETNKPEVLANITLHCLSDLLRERQLVTTQ